MIVTGARCNKCIVCLEKAFHHADRDHEGKRSENKPRKFSMPFTSCDCSPRDPVACAPREPLQSPRSREKTPRLLYPSMCWGVTPAPMFKDLWYQSTPAPISGSRARRQAGGRKLVPEKLQFRGRYRRTSGVGKWG